MIPFLLTVKDVCFKLKICPAKLYKDMKDRKLKPTKIGKCLRFTEASVIRYIGLNNADLRIGKTGRQRKKISR